MVASGDGIESHSYEAVMLLSAIVTEPVMDFSIFGNDEVVMLFKFGLGASWIMLFIIRFLTNMPSRPTKDQKGCNKTSTYKIIIMLILKSV